MKLILTLITIVISYGSIAQDTVAYDQFLLNPYMIEWAPRETPEMNNLEFKSPLEYICSKHSLICPKLKEPTGMFGDTIPETDTCSYTDETQIWDNNYVWLENEKFLRDFEAITIHPAGVSDGGLFLPSSLRFYMENGKISEDWDTHYQSFYAKKFEVTNREYWEFIRYVRDSIARTLLAKVYPEDYYSDSSKKILNWDTPLIYGVEEEESVFNPRKQDILAVMYYPPFERYYNRRDIDPRKLIYRTMDGDVVNVYPDTLSWEHDYVAPIMEPLTNMYNWHPAYDNAPVVGVSKQQAEAYLEWKTKDFKKMFNKLGYEISLSLPSPAEWEIMNIFQINDIYLPTSWRKINQAFDRNLKANLELSSGAHNGQSQIFEKYRVGRHVNTNYANIKYYYKHDLDVSMCEINKKGKVKFRSIMGLMPQIEPNNLLYGNSIYMLANNVSEWIDYEKDGKSMVKGGNWLHDYPLIDQDINQGAYLQTFISPKEQHATLGFRYVIRVKNPNQNNNNRIISEKAINAFYMQQICSEWRLPVTELSRFFKSDTLHLTKKIPGDKSFRFQLDGSLSIHQPIQLNETRTKISESDLGSFGVIDGVMLNSSIDKPYSAKYKINLDQGIIKFYIQNQTFRYKIIKLNFIDFVLVCIR